MRKWKKSDIGKVIVYRGEEGLDNKVIIYDVDSNTPNRIGFVEYPLSLKSEIYSRVLNSRIGLVGLIKNQEKESQQYFRNAGDWCFLERVSKDELDELRRIRESNRDIPDIA